MEWKGFPARYDKESKSGYVRTVMLYVWGKEEGSNLGYLRLTGILTGFIIKYSQGKPIHVCLN